MRRLFKYFSFFALPLIISCADKFDINQFATDNNNVNIGGDTAYVQISPSWVGFNKPQDIYIGKEPFIYVADTDNDRIVMMNLVADIEYAID